MTSSSAGIRVQVRFFQELFRDKDRIVIPEYQRPYEWGAEKTAVLLDDLCEHFLTKARRTPYYMGTILFHHERKDQVYEVIDGQQRLTTLLIILHQLQGSIPAHTDLVFNSYISVRSIRETRDFIQANRKYFDRLLEAGFLSLLEFTEVVTDTEDDAFSFFDTQNNRGVTLGATDFLKAYHLREISSEMLQDNCAGQWEMNGMAWEKENFLDFLFQKILYRSRAWRSKNTPAEGKEELLDIFQKKALEPISGYSFPLYANNHNRRATARSYSDDGRSEDQVSDEINLSQPFSLRQPIHRGLQFFHYAEKYAAMHELLFESKTRQETAISRMRDFYERVYTDDMSVYLRHLFKLAVIMYYDVFGSQQLLQFAHYLDYLLGSARIKNALVRRETAQHLLADPDLNLLDVIAWAYRPEEIFDFIRRVQGIWTIYQEYNNNKQEPEKEDVRSRYRKRVTAYFNKTLTDFYDRKSWLER